MARAALPERFVEEKLDRGEATVPLDNDVFIPVFLDENRFVDEIAVIGNRHGESSIAIFCQRIFSNSNWLA